MELLYAAPSQIKHRPTSQNRVGAGCVLGCKLRGLTLSLARACFCKNTETKTIEELANSLTLEQVKEQVALYHRLYHKLRKEQDPEYIKRKSEKERERYWKNRAKDKPKKYNKKYNATEFMILILAYTHQTYTFPFLNQPSTRLECIFNWCPITIN